MSIDKGEWKTVSGENSKRKNANGRSLDGNVRAYERSVSANPYDAIRFESDGEEVQFAETVICVSFYLKRLGNFSRSNSPFYYNF